ncbi:hypothetical protein CC78DRAFT_620347 [Lojkania enalia]|uniref:Uncharacterized protein n=1 Tax=Lojkania enalia TaxID=147567 RepID=A0A9P4K2L4_9PLEO|nr:hypothetical protein CC78DRAFT_620347 [Didymosphaeria enalia]
MYAVTGTGRVTEFVWFITDRASIESRKNKAYSLAYNVSSSKEWKIIKAFLTYFALELGGGYS